MELLELQNVSFGYKNTPVIQNLSLAVKKGSFTTLLGPSGCGKTTILRLISGFLNPVSGNIFINGQLQNGILPNRRKVGMVFQDYALFPHFTVEQNLLYGLKLKDRKASKEKLFQKVHEISAILGIEKLLLRYPSELSGGQQQRVALGRALVLEPEILLMDEPLSSLDTNLRLRVREELKEIQQNLEITTVYVTHDQEEALSLSDSIAVMNEGDVVQYDSPDKIYFEPSSRFVAEYTGRTNFYENDGRLVLVRPEWISLSKQNEAEKYAFTGTVKGIQFLGDKYMYRIDVNGKTFSVEASCTEKLLEKGTSVGLAFQRESLI